MIYLTNKRIRKDEQFNDKEYLEKMVFCTDEKGVLNIARCIDDSLGVYETVDDIKSATHISKVKLKWNRENIEPILRQYRFYLQLIFTTDKRYQNVQEYVKGSFCLNKVINRADRIRKLLELGAPNCIIENEKICLLENIVFNNFAEKYEDIKRK